MCRRQLAQMSDKAIVYQLGRRSAATSARRSSARHRGEVWRPCAASTAAAIRPKPGDEDALCSTCRSFKDRSRSRGPYDPGAAHALASFANRRPDGPRFWVG